MNFYKKTLIIFFILSSSIHGEMVRINFNNLSVIDFIEMVRKITDTYISIEEKVSEKINFITNKDGIEKNKLIPLTQVILKSKGMVLKEIKNGYKVVKLEEKKETNIKTVLFQVSDKNNELISLLKKCEKYKYMSNKDGSFYLIVTANKELLLSLKKSL